MYKLKINSFFIILLNADIQQTGQYIKIFRYK